MQQHLQSLKKGSGGARIGAGRKAKEVTAISITVPTEQLKAVDLIAGKRSEHYTKAMEAYLKVIALQ